MSAQPMGLSATAAGRVELVPVTMPDTPLGSHEIAGRTLTTLMSPGTELSIIAGLLMPFPFQLGYASVFEVEQVGSDVKHIAEGDRVMSMGHHKSHQRCDAAAAVKLPTNLSAEAATYARLMVVSMATLATTPARPPALVLVTGLGLVGNLAAQIFQSCGYNLLAVDPHAGRREIAESVGVRRVLAEVPGDDASIARQIELQVECSGHESATLDGAKAIRPGGEISLVGCPWTRKTDRYAHELLHEIFHHYVTVRSGWEWQLPMQQEKFKSHSVWSHMRDAVRWLDEGRVKTEGLAKLIKPQAAQQAYDSLRGQTAETLTYALDWR